MKFLPIESVTLVGLYSIVFIITLISVSFYRVTAVACMTSFSSK